MGHNQPRGDYGLEERTTHDTTSTVHAAGQRDISDWMDDCEHGLHHLDLHVFCSPSILDLSSHEPRLVFFLAHRRPSSFSHAEYRIRSACRRPHPYQCMPRDHTSPRVPQADFPPRAEGRTSPRVPTAAQFFACRWPRSSFAGRWPHSSSQAAGRILRRVPRAAIFPARCRPLSLLRAEGRTLSHAPQAALFFARRRPPFSLACRRPHRLPRVLTAALLVLRSRAEGRIFFLMHQTSSFKGHVLSRRPSAVLLR
jgi:hypothetical protein